MSAWGLSGSVGELGSLLQHSGSRVSACALSCGSSSLTNDQTWASCIGSTEFEPLDHQESPYCLTDFNVCCTEDSSFILLSIVFWFLDLNPFQKYLSSEFSRGFLSSYSKGPLSLSPFSCFSFFPSLNEENLFSLSVCKHTRCVQCSCFYSV